MSKIYLEVNGARYEGFTEISIDDSMETFAQQFSFGTTVKENSLGVVQTEIRLQDKVRIFIDDNLFLTGYIEDLDIGYSANSHNIVYSGRSLTGDLVDSSIKQKTYLIRDFKFLIETVLKDNGFANKVIDTVGNLKLEANENIKTETSDTFISFVDRYAKKVQVILLTDKNGDIIIARESQDELKGYLNNTFNGNNNILSANLQLTTKDRFNTIEVFSSFNGEHVKKSIVQTAIAQDNNIRSTRKKIINQTTASKTQNLTDLAKWNVNIRRAKGSRYNCRVSGFYAYKGELFNINKRINIKDYNCLIDGQFLIQGVNFTQSAQGSFTDLSIVEIGSFSLEGVDKFTKNNFGKDLIKL